eukprot:TRINITY_DN522_c0_g1_i5.p1 TRINITY_DN522_c0_g1~~TRINITY_DN522_c0_g1_i5.p1  ORF type:complete len:292 (-),score=-52.62 TRINITY_DN522_c0_g1_i5:2630-3505(-)
MLFIWLVGYICARLQTINSTINDAQTACYRLSTKWWCGTRQFLYNQSNRGHTAVTNVSKLDHPCQKLGYWWRGYVFGSWCGTNGCQVRCMCNLQSQAATPRESRHCAYTQCTASQYKNSQLCAMLGYIGAPRNYLQMFNQRCRGVEDTPTFLPRQGEIGAFISSTQKTRETWHAPRIRRQLYFKGFFSVYGTYSYATVQQSVRGADLETKVDGRTVADILMSMKKTPANLELLNAMGIPTGGGDLFDHTALNNNGCINYTINCTIHNRQTRYIFLTSLVFYYTAAPGVLQY